MVTARQAANYLCSYLECYRSEYARLTDHPRGYPKMRISPYLDTGSLTAYLASDGAAVAVFTDLDGYTEPPAAGKVVRQFPDDLDPKSEAFMVAMGVLPPVIDSAIDRTRGGNLVTTIHVFEYETTLKDLAQRLTFGGLEQLVPKFLDSSAGFWDPFIIRNMCFGTRDQPYRRLYHHLEFLFHVHPAAWDSRSNWMRAHIDIGRDYAKTLRGAGVPGQSGLINLGTGGQPWGFPAFDSVLSAYYKALEEFAALLNAGISDEAVFHELLKRNPILLEPAGSVTSKPRFYYPLGSPRPHDKGYLEPDFVVTYPFVNQYRLIELESPAKQVQTERGHPRSSLTQAVHQVAEWRRFISEHYDVVRGRFPGIHIQPNCSSTVVIGRSGPLSETDRMERDEIRLTFPDVQILSYDELYERAREVYEKVKTVGLSLPRPPSTAAEGGS
jgi:hypothetical protein